MKKITISGLEKHFVSLADNGLSIDELFNEFASIIGAKFVKYKYRYPDSYGAVISKHTIVNLFYNSNRNTFGFQALQYNGTIDTVLSSQNSDSNITDTIIRLASIIGPFAGDYSESDESESDESSESENDSDSRDD